MLVGEMVKQIGKILAKWLVSIGCPLEALTLYPRIHAGHEDVDLLRITVIAKYMYKQMRDDDFDAREPEEKVAGRFANGGRHYVPILASDAVIERRKL